MGYKLEIKKRIDLWDIGTDNQGNPFFVEIKNINAMAYGDKMAYLAAVAEAYGGIDIEKVKAGDLSSFKLDADKLKALNESIKKLVVSWNLVDFNDQPVNINDANAFDRVPGIVVERISQALQTVNQQEDEQAKN